MHRQPQWFRFGLIWAAILLTGTNAVRAQAANSPPPEAVPVRVDTDGRLNLDLRDIELTSFVNLMARLNGLVTITGDDVKGKITVFAPCSLSMEDAFLVLSAVLDAYGYTLIRTDKLLKVVKKTEATQKPIEVGYGADPDAIPAEDRVITQVVPLAHVEARQLLESLRPLVSSTGNVFCSENTNSLLITDVATNVRRLVLLVGMLDRARPPEEPSTMTTVYPVRYMKAKEVSDALEKVFASAPAAAKEGATADGAGIRMTPVEAANAIIVTAPTGLHPEVRRTLESLDVRRLQVLIEARIVEASFSDTVGFGTSIDKYLTSVGGTNVSLIAGKKLADPTLAVTLTRDKFEGLIQALVDEDRISILACPRLLTSDNQKAKITVGQEQPILKSVTALGEEGAGSGKTVSDFVYKDVGIDLEVTPRINVDRDVALEVAVSITSILSEVEFPGNVNAPLIGKREAKTSVIVQDGSTLVIGGLVGTNSRREQSGLPLLSRIPVLGRLLGSSRWHNERTEMLVFLTPQVVGTAQEGEALTREELSKAKRVEAVQSEKADSHE